MDAIEKRNSFLTIAVALALATAVLVVASKNMIVDLDLFHELSLARQIDQEGLMPTKDSFAYTPTIDKVVHHEWLTGVFLYWLCVKLGGGSIALVACKYILTIGITVGCFCYARRNGCALHLFATLAPLALLVGGWIAFTNVRAQAFTLLFLVMTFWLLDVDRRGGRWWIIVWLPLVMIWGNFHGGVVSGIGIIGCYGIAKTLEAYLATRSVTETFRSIRYLLLTGIATAALINVSPYGTDYVPYLIRAIRLPRPLITEWDPIWATDVWSVIAIYLITLGIAALAMWQYFSGDRKTNESFKFSAGLRTNDSKDQSPFVNLFPIMAVGLTAYLSAKHQRHGSLYAVTWICLVPPMLVGTSVDQVLSQMWIKYRQPIMIASFAFAIVAIGFSINNRFWQLQIPSQTSSVDRKEVLYPVGPTDYLADQSFTGNLMAPFNYAAYVSWKTPTVKVSIDSRYEVAYPPGAVEESVAFYHALPGWEEQLTNYPPDVILLPQLAPLAVNHLETLQAMGWQPHYRDQSFLLLFPTGSSLPIVDRSTETIVGTFP